VSKKAPKKWQKCQFWGSDGSRTQRQKTRWPVKRTLLRTRYKGAGSKNKIFANLLPSAESTAKLLLLVVNVSKSVAVAGAQGLVERICSLPSGFEHNRDSLLQQNGPSPLLHAPHGMCSAILSRNPSASAALSAHRTQSAVMRTY
jgi:hypothetical protein